MDDISDLALAGDYESLAARLDVEEKREILRDAIEHGPDNLTEFLFGVWMHQMEILLDLHSENPS
jgi:hypothetical protein